MNKLCKPILKPFMVYSLQSRAHWAAFFSGYVSCNACFCCDRCEKTICAAGWVAFLSLNSGFVHLWWKHVGNRSRLLFRVNMVCQNGLVLAFASYLVFRWPIIFVLRLCLVSQCTLLCHCLDPSKLKSLGLFVFHQMFHFYFLANLRR